MRTATIGLAMFCAVMCGGCSLVSGDAQISPDEYDRSCETDDDCTTVLAGDICDCGYAAAIAEDETDEYADDRADIVFTCNRRRVCDEWKPKAACLEGTCEVAPHADRESSADGE